MGYKISTVYGFNINKKGTIYKIRKKENGKKKLWKIKFFQTFQEDNLDLIFCELKKCKIFSLKLLNQSIKLSRI